MISPTLDRVIDAIVRIDIHCDVAFVSAAGLRWLGVGVAAEMPANFVAWLHAADAPAFRAALGTGVESFVLDVRLLKAERENWVNLRAFRLADTGQYMMCIIDISAWKVDGTALRHAAEHDELTGLPNRSFLRRAMEDLIASDAGPCSVALIDLDGFKKVNDTFGHAIGDDVLVETTRRLGKLLGPEDLLARLGGDEFVIVLKGADAATAKIRLSSALLAIARPYDTAPHNAYLGASIGIAEYPTHGSDHPTLLKHADMAMYHAKNSGKNRISLYVESHDSADFSIKAAIHKGIQEGEFHLEFQPQFDTAGRIIGGEALMRWTSGSYGKMVPDKFIPIIEEAGLMPFMGKWALRYACHQLRKIQHRMPGFVMSVNVSPIQFGDETFDTDVLGVMAETGVDPCTVILEITESTLMRSQARTERALARLREAGIRFSIDDFGTGFSSLAYLTRLPVSCIKIDKTFIHALDRNAATGSVDRKLVVAMIDLAHGIDLKVVAEGVENSNQRTFLEQAGCDLMQGYLLGRPMPATMLMSLLGHPVKTAA